MTALAETFIVNNIRKHPDADNLEIIDVYGDGRTNAIVKKGDFVFGELAIFLPAIADPLVNTKDPLFAMLAKNAKADGFARVKVMKLRGIESRGLVIKCSFDVPPDTDVSETLGIKKYEPVLSFPGFSLGHSITSHGPDALLPGHYDLDGLGKYHHRLIPGEEVILTEKIHGANACFLWTKDQFHVKSRNMWKARSDNAWWEAANECGIEATLRDNPSLQKYAFFGEIHGRVTDLTYGLTDRRFICFDVWDTEARQWLPTLEARSIATAAGLEVVPILYQGPWIVQYPNGVTPVEVYPNLITIEPAADIRLLVSQLAERGLKLDGPPVPGIPLKLIAITQPSPVMYAYAEGNSVLAALRCGKPHVREGFVVEPLDRRTKLKWVGTGYSERKESI